MDIFLTRPERDLGDSADATFLQAFQSQILINNPHGYYSIINLSHSNLTKRSKNSS